MLSIIKNISSKITEKTLEALGFVNVPKGEWKLKSGTLAYATCNSGSQYIPLALEVSYVQLAATASHTVKYGDIVLNTGQEYYRGSARCFCSIDLTKKQISVSGVSSCNVIVWLEKVGGAIAKLLFSLSPLLKKEVTLC